ncbi:MAG: hypothetical protein IPG42_02760 [Betaproteobacteria bacterium]|nr:hypothetical protein [Betaproteobacteria bacterium]
MSTTPTAATPVHAVKLALPMALFFAFCAVAMLAASAWVWQKTLRDEYQASSLRVASLFEVSLQNAMLKRDLAGISDMVAAAARLEGMRDAFLLNNAGQIRFASNMGNLGNSEEETLHGLCLQKACGEISGPKAVWENSALSSGLSVIYPVKNQERCAACHGKTNINPVNGVLVLKFDPAPSALQTAAQLGIWLLPSMMAALSVLALAMRWILKPDPIGDNQA